ncbi:TonB-dependent siderophore receptor [Hirschia litorea]|uniref:TonB-dependent siderophore receptor n=1 Tax=Hirschia litorea TaxID=1199156 RepID=A0ABW2IH27_9PROT
MRTRHYLFASVATLAFATPMAAYAQDSAEAPAEDIARLDTVVVTGTFSSAGQNKIDSSISVSSLNLDEVQGAVPRNTAEVLRQLPGIRTESSSGGGNSNINVRGIPISTGGAKYLSFQEDGLPVLLFGDSNFAPADGFFKVDGTLARVESVRGGTASTLTTNGAGGIVNFIGKTGDIAGGSIALNYGLDHDDFRIDAEYGGDISEDMYYHIGGHFQQGGDFRDSGYDAISGGQLRTSLTKLFDNGKVTVTGKWLKKSDAAYFPQLVSRTDDGNGNGTVGTSLGSFDAADHSIYSNYTRFGQGVDGQGNLDNYDLADGLNHEVKSIAAHANFDLGDGFTFDNKARYQIISGEFLGGFSNGVTLAEDIPGSTYYNGPNAGEAVTAANLPNGVVSNVAIFNVDLEDLNNFANDMRLSKTIDFNGGTLDVVLGHFFMSQSFKQDWHWSEIRTTTENDAVLISTPGSVNGIHGVNQAFGWDGSNRNYDLEAEVSSPFIGINYATGPLTFDASVRMDNMKQNGIRTEAAGGDFDVNNDGVITGSEASVSLNNGTIGAIANLEVDHTAWSVGANYLITDNVSVFGRASSGASFNFDRALDFGVRNAGGALNDGGDDAYVDVVDQYEIGTKWQDLGIASGSADLYATVFFSETEESNLTITPPSGRVREYEAMGLELEGRYNVGNFDLFATMTYTDAEITSASNIATDGSLVADTALTGNKPQRQADVIWAISPSYSFDRFRIGASWVGTTDSYANDSNSLTQDGYSVFNLNAAFSLTDSLELGVNINNLTDEAGITESANDGRDGWDTNGDGLLDTTIGRSIQGRTASATLRYTF